MKIAILGGSGFLGSALIKKLATTSDSELTVFDRNSCPLFETFDVKFLQGSFDRALNFDSLVKNIDVVYHFISTSVPGTALSLTKEIEDNVVPSTLLFEACIRQGVKKVVFLSSGGTIYGNSENKHTEDDLTEPISSYGVQKLIIEEAMRFIFRTSETTYNIIRLSNPYGPGQNPAGKVGLVTVLAYRALNNLPIQIFGDGDIIRDYIYIEDAINGIIKISSHGETNSVYNLGSGTGRSINEVLSIIERTLNKELVVNREEARSADVKTSVLDISKFMGLSPNFKAKSLEDGVNYLIKYMSETSAS